jgi:hypothetical protein
MKTPADGWDREEQGTVEELREQLEALQSRHAQDPPIDALRAARHDALPPDTQAVIESRLANDPWNRTLAEGLDEVEPPFEQGDADRLLARIRQDAARGESAAPAFWLWLRPALAMVAVFAVGLAAWAVLRQTPAPPPATTAPPEQSIAAAPATPAFQLPLDKPDVTLSLAAMTWRGSRGNNQLLTDLKVPLDAFREGNYPVADREFSALEARYPDAVEVFLYGGVARLFLNEPNRALAALTRAGDLADSTLIDRVNWYRAVAEQRAGRVADARRRLDALCRGGGNYGAQACRAGEQMDATAKTPEAR